MRSIFLFFLFILSYNISDAQTWSKLGTGISGLNAVGNGGPNNMCVDKNGNVYVAGWDWDMSLDSNYQYANVYKWDGTAWSELGSGINALNSYVGFGGAHIGSLCVDSNSNVYVCAGDDTGATYIAKWNGISWTSLGGTTPFLQYEPMAMCSDKNGALYVVCDSFDTVFHVRLEKWDGISWTVVDTGSSPFHINNHINTMFIDTMNNIFIGGTFTDGATYGTGNVCVAKWNGISWSEVGAGIAPQYMNDIEIFALLPDTSGNLYAAGNFRNSSNKCYVAKWDGTTWSELGTGASAMNANDAIFSLCWDPGGNLYAGGAFNDTTLAITVTLPNDTEVIHPSYVAKWNGTGWSQLAPNSLNANNWIMSLSSDLSGNIYSVGNFTDTSITHFDLSDTISISPLLIDTVYTHPYYVAKYNNPALSVTSLQSATGINVYPNPTRNIINISTNNVSNDLTGTAYVLYDCQGKLCHSGKLNGAVTSIDVIDVAPGVYILSFSNKGLGTYRIVKQ
jgi:hypothetical protein